MLHNIYLDHNSSTPCDPDILDLYRDVSMKTIGNPHASEHAWGWEAERIVEESKVEIADYLNALSDEIIFTSGASESNNHAIIGIGTSAFLKKSKKRKILVSSIEHKCVLNAANHLQRLFGFEVTLIPVNTLGIIDLNFLEKEIDQNTLLVSIMATNNEIGTCQPLSAIGTLCSHHDTIFHVDAAQAVYSDIDVIKNNIDLLSLSGHKIYAPKGVGVLYVNQDISPQLSPIIHGGGQQAGLRAGTLSPALCASMAKAVNLMKINKETEKKKLLNLKEIFTKELNRQGVRYKINGDAINRSPCNLNLQFHNTDTKALILRLQPKIAISTGSACNSDMIKPSYVLKAIGLTDKQIENSIRLAFGRFSTNEEALFAAQMISTEIRAISNNV